MLRIFKLFPLFTIVVIGLVVGCQMAQPLMPISENQPQSQSGIENLTDKPTDSPPIQDSSTKVSDTEPIEVLTPPSAISTVTSTTTLTAAISLPSVPSNVTDELITAGEEVYLKQYCGICHQLDALETRGTFGPTHNNMVQTAEERLQDPNYRGQAETVAEYLMESLVDPTIYIVPNYALTSHPMPEYSYLSEANLQALVALLLQQ